MLNLESLSIKATDSIKNLCKRRLEEAFSKRVQLKDIEELKADIMEVSVQTDGTESLDMDTYEIMSIIEEDEELTALYIQRVSKTKALLNAATNIICEELFRTSQQMATDIIDEVVEKVNKDLKVSQYKSVSIFLGHSSILDHLPPSNYIGDLEHFDIKEEGVKADLLKFTIKGVQFHARCDY
jgi:hypothetical protein